MPRNGSARFGNPPRALNKDAVSAYAQACRFRACQNVMMRRTGARTTSS